MAICKIISLVIKHIVMCNNLSIKLYSFFNFLTLSYSLNCMMVIVEENVFFQ